eukprot:3391760-Pyramimonas_sp.AAC.1
MELKCGGQCPKGAARYARLPAETSGGVGEAFNCENRTSSGLGISRDRSPTRAVRDEDIYKHARAFRELPPGGGGAACHI